MADFAANNPFRPYSDYRNVFPRWVWDAGRLAALGVTFWVLWLLVFDPELGITMFWRIFIPSLPLVFAVMPGVWRQVCPMAFLNQLPVRNGLSAGHTLPLWLKESSYLFAIIAFVALVGMKHVTFYDSAFPLFVMLALALAAAFIGGLVFKGRSGWCGTFCPLGPLQKVYGHAPPVVVKNGYCETSCVGCQKNCYDFSPRSAFFADLSDKDSWYAGHRRIFVGLLPGLILSFWLGRSPEVIGYGTYFQELAFWLLLSAGSFFIATSVLKNSVYKVAAVYGVVAIFLYYWFAAPVILGGIRDVFGIALPDILAYLLQAVVVIVVARNLYAGFQLEQAYEQAQAMGGLAAFAAAGAGAAATKGPDAGGARPGVATLIERSSGKQIAIDPSKSILELMEDAGLAIDFGCRTGMCGADPIHIEEGDDHLSPPSATELDTLRRLGLEGKARMACVCKARKGPITVNLAADLAKVASASPAQPAEDLAEMVGVGRVVIVGNGVAGVTAADRLRQASPSLKIDVVSRENHHFYNRMAIGRAIHGRSGMDGLDLLAPDWAKKNNIDVWLNTIVRGIDREGRTVQLGTGQTLPYDKLILATGGRANVPPIPGKELPGCFVLRDANDALRIRAWRQEHACRSAVVVGGGVLGIEAADALRKLGLEVTIVHRSDRLMDRNLDAEGSVVLAGFLAEQGFQLEMGAELASVTAGADDLAPGGAQRAASVTLTDGRQLDADIVLFAIGVSGETDLARRADLAVNRGIVVDAAMRTSDPDVYAIGDVAEFGSGPSGLWTLGTQHAQLATDDLLNRREGSTVPRTVMLAKLSEIDVVAYGDPGRRQLGQEEFIDTDAPTDVRRRLIVENGRVVGAFFVGPPGTAQGVAELIRNDSDVRSLLPELRRGNWDVLAEDPTTFGQDINADVADVAAIPSPDGDGSARATPRVAFAWAVGILMGLGLAGGAGMLVGLEPDEMQMENVMAMVDDALKPKRQSSDATDRFTQGSGVDAEPAIVVLPATDQPINGADGSDGDDQQAQAEVLEGDGTGETTGADRTRLPENSGTTETDATTDIAGDAGRDENETTSDATPDPITETPITVETDSETSVTDPIGSDTFAPDTRGAPVDDTEGRQDGLPDDAAVEPDDTQRDVADGGRLLAADMRALLPGRDIVGGRDFGGQRFDLRLSPGGRAEVRIRSRNPLDPPVIDRGTWTVDGDVVCVRFRFAASRRATCSAMERVGAGYRFLAPNGRARGWQLR